MNKMILVISRLTVLSFAVTLLVGSIAAQGSYSANLDGKYRLDKSRSEDVAGMVDSIARSQGLSANQKDQLIDQLNPPETISISTSRTDKNSVTIGTSVSAETTFQTNGGSQSVRQDDGSESRITASLRNGRLRLSKVGADSSYSITFASSDNGSSLRVTRMITTGYLEQTVYADSFYTREGTYSGVDPANDKDDDTGYSSSDNDDVYTDSSPPANNGNKPTAKRTVSGRFVVPKGVVLEGSLDNKITTKASQDNDRFTLTIDSPSEFRGAVVEGYLTGIKRTGRVSGSAKLTFNFETIKLRTGEVYDFAGVLQSVTDSTGKVIEIGKEGDAKSKSRTKESVKRGGIGAGLGAIIGGILGGGKGAIIGATIGGSAGAGSVIAEGREDVELLPGSKVTVESSSPNTVNR
jgi:hypothetical protein